MTTNNLGSNRSDRKFFADGGAANGYCKHPRPYSKRMTGKRARKAARLAALHND